MLTEKQYQTLCRFRDNLVPALGKPDEATQYLYSRGFIRPKKVEYTQEDECIAFYQKVFWEITASGKQALEEFDDSVQKVAQEKAKHDEEKRSEQLQAEKDKKQSFRHDFVVAGFTVLLTLIVEHIQEILYLIQKILSLFQ